MPDRRRRAKHRARAAAGSRLTLTPEQDESLNRAVKSAERVQLLKFVVPLVAAGIGVGWLYLGFGMELRRYWIGATMSFTGALLGAVGGVRRWRETRTPGAPTTRHYPLLLLAWVLVAAGAVIPPYTSQ